MFLPLLDRNPTRRFPAFTILLIAVNVLVFAWTALGQGGLEASVLRFGAIPYALTHAGPLPGFPVERVSPVLAVFASMFIHGSFFHLLGNMLYLWVFGNNVEDFLGPARFLIFYFLGGAAAAGTHIALHPGSMLPMIGASGAIAAVLGAYLVLFPRARVITLVLIWIVPIPAAFVLGAWFLLQLFSAGMGGGVAWFAHIGGFLAGILLVRPLAAKKRPSELT